MDRIFKLDTVRGVVESIVYVKATFYTSNSPTLKSKFYPAFARGYLVLGFGSPGTGETDLI